MPKKETVKVICEWCGKKESEITMKFERGMLVCRKCQSNFTIKNREFNENDR